MLSRVPTISAYDPSTKIMLAHASPSYKIATMITGLVIDCLGTNNFLVLQKLSTKELTFIILQLIVVLLSRKLLLVLFLQTYPITYKIVSYLF
jgi:hypothetical protein